MAAPNEELLLLAQTLEFSDNVRCTIQQAADLLQSQAERIKVLEAKVEQLKVVPMKYRRMEFNAQLQKENETLRVQIAEMAASEPVAWGMPDASGNIVDTITELDRVGDITKWAEQYPIPLYAVAPAPQLVQEDYATKSS